MGNQESSFQNAYKEYEAAFSYSDVLIELPSLSDIKQGWKIISNPKDKSKIAERFTQQPTYILGFFGKENNIKANLINKFCGYSKLTQNIQDLDLFQGMKIRFSQLKMFNNLKTEKDKSLKPHHKILTCLSSGTREYPVFFHKDQRIFKFFSKCHEIGHVLSDGHSSTKLNNENYENLKSLMMNDKYLTESFIENFIMEVSDMIIIVINDLDFEDQKYIEKIIANYNQKKKIFIIHYFENVADSVEIQQKIRKQINGAFLVKEQQINLKNLYPNLPEKKYAKINRLMYVGDSINQPSSLINPDDKNCVIHLVYTKEDTKLGKFYNKTTFDYILFLINSSATAFKPFPFTEKMKSFLEENYLNYFQINPKNEKKPLEINVNDDLQSNQRYLKAQISYDIKYLKDPKYDVLGNPINVNVSGFTPPYYTFEKKNCFEIIIEAPLLKKDSLKVGMDKDKSYQFLLVTGEKINNFNSDINNKVLDVRGNLESGKFLLRIPLAPYSVRLKKRREIDYRDGLVVIRLLKGDGLDDQMLTEENLKMDDIKLSNFNFEEK